MTSPEIKACQGECIVAVSSLKERALTHAERVALLAASAAQGIAAGEAARGSEGLRLIAELRDHLLHATTKLANMKMGGGEHVQACLALDRAEALLGINAQGQPVHNGGPPLIPSVEQIAATLRDATEPATEQGWLDRLRSVAAAANKRPDHTAHGDKTDLRAAGNAAIVRLETMAWSGAATPDRYLAEITLSNGHSFGGRGDDVASAARSCMKILREWCAERVALQGAVVAEIDQQTR